MVAAIVGEKAAWLFPMVQLMIIGVVFWQAAHAPRDSTPSSFARLTDFADNCFANKLLTRDLGFDISAQPSNSYFFQLGGETLDLPIGFLHAIIPMIQFSSLSSGHRTCEADFARNEVYLDVIRMGDGLRARYSKLLSPAELFFPFNFVLKRFIEQSLNLQRPRLFRLG